ncbi:filamin-A isoform X2 [Planococcus citri]|uniref:filamin-A isoform X2 n=1 Tax=Planococcus citri TaxID=170843 RepID=UPI0031FA3023
MNGSGISNGERCSRSNSLGLGTGTGSSGTGSCASIIADQQPNASINNNCVGGGSLYDQEAEDEMVATERELAEDAQWKRIQQNTFTRWANEHLKTVDKNIGNLETDLSDGLRLITLIEVLSGKRLPKHTKRPTFRSQKLENVSVALKFLEDEGIKIVNIDSTDIVDCKLKLILGLIWTLILHYSISMPMWEYEGDNDQNHTDKGPTPKQRLLNWIQCKIPDLPITNFTTDWNDGKAVGALVDAVAPGLCPDWQDWKSQNALQNAKEAMGLADDWLDVKQLIKPEELVNPNMDELSMMTYLSQYPNAKLKHGAPLRPKTNANRVRAYGPGIEPKGPLVKAPAKFTVETFSAGSGEVDVKVENPKGQIEPVDIRYNNDRSKTYSVSYTPKMEGKHKVNVYFAGKEIPKSPYTVSVEGTAGDVTKVTASGPGLQPDGVMVSRGTYFDIFTKDAGQGTPEVIIVDTAGQQNALSMKLYQTSPGVWRCEYIPTAAGPINVNIFFENQVIPNSPFTVRVQPVSDAKKVKVTGRGVQTNGIRVSDSALFHINTEKAGEGKPEVQIIGPGGVNEPATIKKVDNGLYDVTYHPKRQGRHVIMVTFAGQEVPRSPFEVNVGPYKETKIQAYGPGLVGGIVNQPAQFTVESNGETGALGFSIEGPSQAKIECDDNGDGSADIRYYPTAPGEYAVHILCDNEDIPNSPFMAQVLPSTDYYPDKVECSGPGIGKGNLPLGVPVDFTVDTRKAGNAPLDIKVLDANSKPVPVNTKDNHNGTYTSQYTPKTGKKHTIQVNYGGVAVPGSPFKVHVAQPLRPEKVQIFGPGIESGVKPNRPTHFTADCRDAGPGKLDLKLKSDLGSEIPLDITDNEDGTYLIDYSVPAPGDYTLNCRYEGVQVPQSPLKIKVPANVDVSKIKVDGLETSVCLHSKADILVDSRDLGIRDDGKKVTCTITNPSGTKTENFITPLSDGTYKISYTPFEEGPHTIEILYDGLPIPGSPFVVNVKKGTDPTKCKAYGPGLVKGVVNEQNKFTVETRGAGTGGLGLAIEGPSEALMTCKDNRDGSCTVEYKPTEPGDYDITIKFADQHIPGSPYKVEVAPDIDVKKIKVYGPGIDHCRAQIPSSFKIDASKVDKAPLDVSLQTDRGLLETKPEVYDNGDGTYDVVYVAGAEGSTLTAKILYNGEHIPNSPFKLKVRPSSEPERVKVTGPVATIKGGVFASIPTEFGIDTSQAGVGNLDVQVIGPDSQPRKAKVIDNENGTYQVQFTPDDCGLYSIPVKFNGQNVPSSPLHVQAYATGNANECKLPPIHNEVLRSNEEHKLIIDAKKAGHGKATCRIKSISGKDADVKVIDNGDGTFTIYYKLQEPGEYTLNVKFGGQPVPGGLCAFTVKDEEEYLQHVKKYSEQSSVNSVQEEFRSFTLNNIPLPTTGGHVTAEVKMPSGKVDKPVIEDNRDGTVSLKYEPREEGLHELLVKYNGEHVQGSPFKFHVDSISSGYVTAYGPGLTHGVSGEPANFTISTKGAGAGGLSLAVEGPSKAEISCHDNKDGTVAVSYLPTAPGEYKITVKFGDKHIKGSPYNAKVTGEGRKRNQISVGSCSEVSFPGKVTDADTRLLNASIQAPSGLEEPCFLKKLPSGNLGISFTPREIGEHVVSVKRMGKHITNSPFKIKVGDKEVGDAKKVKVSGGALQQGKTHVENFFNVDTRNAGFGGLSLSIEGPSKAEIQCKDNEDGTLKISYKPTEPGYYIVNLKFADHHVEGSPFTVKVTGEGSNRQREKIEKHREAVPITEVGSQCKLSFKMPGITTLDLMASVASPAGVVEDAEILEVEDGLYGVHFVPKELGVHTVSVKYKDIHIPGSPFQFTVGPLRDGGAHRVHAGGPGLERGEQGQPCEFNVWTREAGAGSLAISVEGPSKAEIDFKDRKDGSCYVSYVVSEPGEYRVGIKFNEQHIPDSPYKLFISPALGDAHKLEVAQFPAGAVQADSPSHFLVHKNGAKGELDGRLIAPSGAEDDCFIQSIDADTFSVRFMPRENGVHNIHIKFNGVHIPGSPMRIKVGKDDADPAAVHAHGNGLGDVKTGHKTDFIVDTCNAGAGTLAVTIDGPSKVSMDCTEVEEGYKVRYTPLVPGDYYISLKYNGYHIVGSPFKVKCLGENLAEIGAQETSSVIVETVHKTSKPKVTGPQLPHFKSDASKVTCKGVGLKKAYLQKQNQFTVQAGDAGNNILFVGLYGPKGPCEEVFIKHTGRNNYNVNYMCRERGEYIIFVKWGEDHIPGSPFRVEV